MVEDEELMGRVQRGDLEAFNILMKRHKDSVVHFCYRMTGDREEGEDIAQEVFIRLFKSAESYRPQAKFTVFLYTIARNLCLNVMDKQRRRPGSVSLEAEAERIEQIRSDRPAPPEELISKMALEAAERAIQELPERLRCVFVLSFYEGLKYREIAEVLGGPTGTIKSRMAEACKRLRHKLEAVRWDV